MVDEYESLRAVGEDLVARGCFAVVAKLLAPHQDNEKNQIYLGRGVPTSQLFPGTLEFRGLSGSSSKRAVSAGQPITSLAVPFRWVWPSGETSQAPHVKLIEYAQYPESRLSGFLRGADRAPDALRRDRQAQFGDRVLVLGIAESEVFGAVLTAAGTPGVRNEYGDLQPWDAVPIFRLVSSRERNFGAAQDLIHEIGSLVRVPHFPQALRVAGGEPESIALTSQAAGWTLEALLGIPRNSISAPDKYGYEIKSVGGGKVSLITTEPDFGVRHEQGFEVYMARYGRAGTTNPSQRVFSGVHQAWEMNSVTGCVLEIRNWDRRRSAPSGNEAPEIVLRHVESSEIVSGWSFEKIGNAWMKKHAGAVYVETGRLETDGQISYTFGPTVIVAEGTTALHFFRGVSDGLIRLDPGDRIDPAAGAKKRTQWRVQGAINSLLLGRLSQLYVSTRLETLPTLQP